MRSALVGSIYYCKIGGLEFFYKYQSGYYGALTSHETYIDVGNSHLGAEGRLGEDNYVKDFREATPEEKIWYNRCIARGSYKPREGTKEKTREFRQGDLLYAVRGKDNYKWYFIFESHNISMSSFFIQNLKVNNNGGTSFDDCKVTLATPKDFMDLERLGYKVEDNKFVPITKKASEQKFYKCIEWLGDDFINGKIYTCCLEGTITKELPSLGSIDPLRYPSRFKEVTTNISDLYQATFKEKPKEKEINKTILEDEEELYI